MWGCVKHREVNERAALEQQLEKTRAALVDLEEQREIARLEADIAKEEAAAARAPPLSEEDLTLMVEELVAQKVEVAVQQAVERFTCSAVASCHATERAQPEACSTSAPPPAGLEQPRRGPQTPPASRGEARPVSRRPRVALATSASPGGSTAAIGWVSSAPPSETATGTVPFATLRAKISTPESAGSRMSWVTSRRPVGVTESGPPSASSRMDSLGA